MAFDFFFTAVAAVAALRSGVCRSWRVLSRHVLPRPVHGSAPAQCVATGPDRGCVLDAFIAADADMALAEYAREARAGTMV